MYRALGSRWIAASDKHRTMGAWLSVSNPLLEWQAIDRQPMGTSRGRRDRALSPPAKILMQKGRPRAHTVYQRSGCTRVRSVDARSLGWWM